MITPEDVPKLPAAYSVVSAPLTVVTSKHSGVPIRADLTLIAAAELLGSADSLADGSFVLTL